MPLPRVRQLLDHQLDRPLTLVCAPAGFGKTTQLSDWLAHCGWPSTWLSLDERDNDPAVFLAYVITAIRRLFPAVCTATAALLQAAQLPPLGVLSAAFVNDIDSIADGELPAGQRFLLVLDDYHLIHNLAVHQLVDDLLQHPPRPLHLVLSTRHDPPLALGAQRARGRMVEVRMAALRFEADETAAFMQQAVHSPVDRETVSLLAKRSEGWVAALRFAALAMNMSGGARAGTPSMPEVVIGSRLIMEYLLNEVLARLPLAMQAFLLQTAILRRLNGSLCDALTAQGDAGLHGQQHLEWLERENVFIVALDDQRHWYRYHHLLQQLLQEELERQVSTEAIAELHGRASAWCAANGYVEDAIMHALAAGDETAAAELVETHRHALMNREQWQVLERWLQLLPRPLIEQRAELLVAEAWLLQSRWRIADTSARLARVETIMQQELPPPGHSAGVAALMGEIETLRSHVAFHQADFHSQLAYAKQALAHTPVSSSSVRGHAWMDYAVAQYLLGDTRGWRATVHEALQEDRLHGNSFPMRVLQAYCFLTWMDADLAGLQEGAGYLLRLAEERELALGSAWGHYFRGCAAYQLDDLDAAAKDFAAVTDSPYSAHGFTYLQAAFGLASVHLARGEWQQAQDLANAVLRYAWERGDQDIMDEAKAFQAYAALQLGRRAEAQRWAAGCDRQRPLIPLIMFHAAPVTLAKVLLQQATAQSLAEAAEWLLRLRTFAAVTNNTRFAIEVQALEALLYHARRQKAAAVEALERALLAAEPGGLLRVFIDLGPEMAALLAQLPEESAGRAYAHRILAARAAGEDGNPPHMGRGMANAANGGLDGLHASLSRRELEVLELLALRLTVKEVAERLVISELTAKRHTSNIYQKLGVNRRRDALAAAQARGLLGARW